MPKSLERAGAVKSSRGALPFLMPAAAAILGVLTAAGIWVAAGWPLVHDAGQSHYLVFLMDHGWAPYRDIVDFNIPGTYIADSLAMRVFGGSAGGWWRWDVVLGLSAVAASAWIAGAGRRTGGMAAGALAYLYHLHDGPMNLAQRDWLVAVLLLGAVGCLFEAVRKKQPCWLAGFAGLCGFAASIKPPAIAVGVIFPALLCWCEKARPPVREPAIGRGLAPIIGWSLLGGLAPAAAAAIFFVRWDDWGAFVDIVRQVVPYYAGLQRLSTPDLIGRAMIPPAFLAGAALIYVLGKSWRRWESNFLATATLAGASLFVIQGKGFPYHFYPEIAFLSLWAMVELQRGLDNMGLQRGLAIATLAFTVAVISPVLLRAAKNARYSMATIASLESDLVRLGGPALSGKVQCLDTVTAGCLNVLYRMRLLPTAGYLNDFYLFPPTGNAVTAALQAGFLEKVTARPPQVIVLSAYTWPGDTYGYQKLDNWPAFADFLRRTYTLDREVPTLLPDSVGYRIYTLNKAAATG